MPHIAEGRCYAITRYATTDIADCRHCYYAIDTMPPLPPYADTTPHISHTYAYIAATLRREPEITLNSVTADAMILYMSCYMTLRQATFVC